MRADPVGGFLLQKAQAGPLANQLPAERFRRRQRLRRGIRRREAADDLARDEGGERVGVHLVGYGVTGLAHDHEVRRG